MLTLMQTHEPLSFVSGLSAKLASRSRHTCLFLGAGTSRACGLPDLNQLTDRVLSKLEPAEKTLFEAQMIGGNLETGLSRLRRISTLLRENQDLEGLSRITAKALDRKICSLISGELHLEDADLDSAQRLAIWAGRSSYHSPVELFTVNYDLILETALEKQKVPYFDGFLGVLRAQFYTELVEGDGEEHLPSFFVRLWKLHGSVNWELTEDIDGSNKRIVRVGHEVKNTQIAAIYPSDEKYQESRRVPFLVLQDRFRRALNESETLVLISGYSFGDSHLNEIIYSAASRRPRSGFVAFLFEEIPLSVAENAEHIPNLQVLSAREAVIGGVRANWSVPEKPDRIWDENGFMLRDFRHLTSYLARISGDSQPNE